MNPRELFLLSAYRLPTQNSLTLSHEDVTAFLNGYAALWHPAALRGANGPPRIASQYDHELPTAGHVYACPETPPLFLPEDWEQRVRDAGSIAFRSTPDREETVNNLLEALRASGGEVPEAGRPALEQAGPFLGLGFGYVQLETLFAAMEHENMLAAAEFWGEVQQALAALDQADLDGCRRSLEAAAGRLLTAREVLYPVTIHLIDLGLLDEDRPGNSLPLALDRGFACNLIASGSTLEKLAHDNPERWTTLRERVQAGQAEVCGGCYVEREDALLPIESQLWNLRKGLAVARDLLGEDLRVFARRRHAFHPQWPVVLTSAGLQRMVLLAFDDAVLPSYRSTVVGWLAPDGRPVEAFTRAPYRADNPLTFFNLAHYLHQTIMQDHAATLALLHAGTPAAPWYQDWLELSRLAPVLGSWTTLTRYLNEVPAGEHLPAPSADEFHDDALAEHTPTHPEQPVSWVARHVRRRRRLDTIWTLAALHRGLAGRNDSVILDARLADLEDGLETGRDVDKELAELQGEMTSVLAERLQARAQADSPGYLVLNPCSFTRRVAVELDEASGPLPITGPLKACQIDGAKTRLVVEVPALGFAWVPRTAPSGTPPQASRIRLADERHVRNEFFEAEIDPATGGLRGLWDHRTRANRLGQQLVYHPGSQMRAAGVKVSSTGPALGEVVSEGALLDPHDQVLATFRQRFRAWLGRPVLDLTIELYPKQPPQGYPWHSYYGARFAWRDERALLLRGLHGPGFITSHTRPVTPDYLELRQGRQSTLLLPGGLPFHQRHGARMLDVLLVSPGETCQTFDLALGLDREYPMQTALGMVTPVPGVVTAKGPPHVGATGWLFHLDAPNLLLLGLRPGPEGADAVIARMLECGLYGGPAELRCVRNPQRAQLVDSHGQLLREMNTQGDAAQFEVVQGDFLQLRVDFSS